MADYVIIRYLFIFLLINVCFGGLPSLDSSDQDVIQSTQSQSQSDNHLQEDLPIDKLKVHYPRYKCYQCETPDCESPDGMSQCSDAISCFKSTVRAADGTVRQTRGCSTKADHYQFTCRTNQPSNGVRKRHAGQLNITCCAGHLCNDGPAPSVTQEKTLWPIWPAIVVIVVVVACLPLVYRRVKRMRSSKKAKQKLGAETNYFNTNVYSPQVTSSYYEGAESAGQVRVTAAGDSTLREFLEEHTSGSGGGLPLMVQRTLAKQITLKQCVGKGRFGEVWLGSWYSDSVAVKIVFSRDEAAWRRETEIYSTVLLRHENIVGYVGSDMTSQGTCTQLWLITHYHPLGSLYEYLHRATLTRHQLMVMLLSIVNGLLHLHTEIHGTQGKPAIAHRDIKSKNILVKVNGECCICDLGLAASRQHLAKGEVTRQGTVRYMSPELLTDSMNMTCLEAHRKCDIYALALVIWEATFRTCYNEYRPPYSEFVGPDPSREKMAAVVCAGNRPTLPGNNHPTMVGLCNLMKECWHQNASVRLPALRIKKTLIKLAQADDSVHLNEDNEVSL